MTAELVIPHLIKEDLRILFVGINPGTRSAAIGHHFAGHSNRFWKFLVESGLTPIKLSGEMDHCILEYGYGITNIVARSTATAAEITTPEFKEGALQLRSLLQKYQPKVAAFLGKDSYRYFGNHPNLAWGLQPVSSIKGLYEFLLPNPSGLNRMPLKNQIQIYQDLREFIDLHL